MLRAISSTFYSALRQNTIRRFSAAATDAANSVPDPNSATVSKEAMIELRKKTGYSFFNCRKALAKFGESHMNEAEKWLHEMATKEGWAKAEKVSSRQTKQGLCGLLTNSNVAAIVELNCETDFVARNADFKKLVETLVTGLMQQGQSSISHFPTDSKLKCINFDTDDVKTSSGQPAKEVITEAIRKLGENIVFSNASLLLSHPDINLLGNCHPRDTIGNVQLGEFVAAVGIKRSESNTGFPTEKLGHQICQHIIGMKPNSLGTPLEAESAEPNEHESTEVSKEEEQMTEDEELNAFAKVESVQIDEDENQLLRQAFMLNPKQSVHEYLEGHGAEVTDFVRFELGKASE
ncbi:elongation factor TS domain-containing protein [Ditylenchus destructor]|nr:elongation factor TS domain-containing protein [Ditylenchus destructor]